MAKSNKETDRLIAEYKRRVMSNEYIALEKSAIKNGWKPKKKTKKIPTKRFVSVKQKVPPIKQMIYKLFLKSDYWKYVRDLILVRDNKTCIHCSNTNKLRVHHKTYDHHYKEHLHLDDLITLCHNCHKKEHDF